ncbi:MAG: hypothetical protein PHT94_03750 [Candidatus Nanoarchaeia archaeon]|nr:hypothetical protein [Candidatus Nanoarchaeia archaeon]
MVNDEYIKFYNRKDILYELVLHSKSKEVVGTNNMNKFMKRPDIIEYESDILALIKSGVTSFHASEELWKDPLLLNSSLNKSKLNSIRIGWDLVLDIDCPFFEYSKKATDLIVKKIEEYGVENVSVKFSGNKGFHVAVPFESFPQSINFSQTSNFFPEYPQKIAKLILDEISDEMRLYLLSKNLSYEKLAEQIKKTKEEIITKDEEGKEILRVDPFIEIDTILIASRHLYRMPFTVNEKSGLISIPIDKNKIMEFEKESAKIENVIVDENIRFLDRTKSKKDEALNLLIEALEHEKNSKSQSFSQRLLNFKTESTYTLSEAEKLSREQRSKEIINESFFPPCMKRKTIKDGKKRFIYLQSCFLQKMNWSIEEIKERIISINNQFDEPIKENYVLSQMNYYVSRKYLTPLCENTMYKEIGICKPDELCLKIKNPWQYAYNKYENQKKLDELKKEKEKKEKKKLKLKNKNKSNLFSKDISKNG